MKKSVKLLIALAAVVLAGGAAFGVYKFLNPAPEEKVMLNEYIELGQLFEYSGEFVEDRSDEQVEGIAAITLTNISKKDFEYIEFSVTSGETTFNFKASAVLAGKSITVLNYGKLPFEKGMKIEKTDLSLCADYIKAPTRADGVFELYESKGVLNIRNISDKTYSNVSVYYKQNDETGMFGGITYKATIDSIAPQEIKQFNSDHFGTVVNIDYEK